MKKLINIFFFLAATLLSLGFFTSCSSSSDDVFEAPTQNYDFTVTFQNVGVTRGIIYVVKDSKFYISSASLSSATRTATPVSKVEYFVNGRLKVRNVFMPFDAAFDARSLSAGTHTLSMNYELLDNDVTVQTSIKDFKVVVVESADQLPEGVTIGEATQTFSVSVR